MGDCKKISSLPASQILKLYRGLIGVRHMSSPNSLTTPYSFKTTFLKMALTVRRVDRVHSKNRGGAEEPLTAQGQLEVMSAEGHILLMTSSNMSVLGNSILG